MLEGSAFSCSQLSEKMGVRARRGLEKPEVTLSHSRATIPRSDLRQNVPKMGLVFRILLTFLASFRSQLTFVM